MAITNTILGRQGFIGLGVEGTPGTAESVTTAAELVAYDVVFEPTFDVGGGERAPISKGGMGTSTYQRGPATGTARFTTELRSGDATMTLFRGCGFGVTTGPVASRISNVVNMETLTLVHWQDGRKKILFGAMGTFTMRPGGPGRRVLIEWEFMGLYDEVADVPVPSAPTITGNLYLNKGMTLTLASASIPYVSEWSLTAGNTVNPREDVTSNEAIRHFIVEDHRQRVTLDPEARLVADHDAYGLLRSMTEQALQIVLVDGTGSGATTLTIDAPKAQRLNVSDADRGQRKVDQIELALNEHPTDPSANPSLELTEA